MIQCNKIYQDKGKFNLLFQIPTILYSTLISKLFDSLIKSLALSQELIIELKQDKGKNNKRKKYFRILRKIKFKIYIFFISFYYFLIFFILHNMFLWNIY